MPGTTKLQVHPFCKARQRRTARAYTEHKYAIIYIDFTLILQVLLILFYRETEASPIILNLLTYLI